MAKPTLIVVSGPPGSGKTTLAHEVSRGVPCPAISRDEIKEGLYHADGGGEVTIGGPMSLRTLAAFFETIGFLLRAGVTVVAEAAFQDKLWKPDLKPLQEVADIRVIHCVVDPEIARERIARRLSEEAGRAAHADMLLLDKLDSGEISLAAFDSIASFAPSIHVDTTDGYRPGLQEIVAFAAQK